jgi:hypothetical protein
LEKTFLIVENWFQNHLLILFQPILFKRLKLFDSYFSFPH